MDNPSRLLWAVRISHPCDPAIDLDHTDAPRLLTVYERSRSDADRDALPILPGVKPYLFGLAPLTRATYAATLDDTEGRAPNAPLTARQAQFAVAYACHVYRDPSGVEHRATTTKHGAIVVADETWLDELADLGGMNLFAELGAVIVRRAEVPAGTLDPFALPRGLRLSR